METVYPTETSVHQESSVVDELKYTVAPVIFASSESVTFIVTLVSPDGAADIATSSKGKSAGIFQESKTDNNPPFEYLTE
ncbi:MAG: Uncharacterised protein [Chloroflexota bacterium]|nr:MAG: Uncharacterised protein [Chloroflexota bacterium]